MHRRAFLKVLGLLPLAAPGAARAAYASGGYVQGVSGALFGESVTDGILPLSAAAGRRLASAAQSAGGSVNLDASFIGGKSVLKLKKDLAPVEVKVELGSGAFLYVRPAETFEHMEAAHKASELLAGLIAGEDAAARASVALGRHFAGADFAVKAWQEAAARAVTLLELTVLCAVRWEGVADETGAVIPAPTREYLALLLRDSEIANRIGAAVRQRVAIEADEGNV